VPRNTYYRSGQKTSGTNYFYSKNHLGSIYELTDGGGVVQSRSSFDPYGRKIKLSGSLESDFQYAGYYRHASSLLDLTMFRNYNPSFSRWLNRDPMGERAGINLFSYANNEPIGNYDPSGLTGENVMIPGVPIQIQISIGAIITVGPTIITTWMRQWRYNRCISKAIMEYWQCINEKIYSEECYPDPDKAEKECEEEKERKLRKCWNRLVAAGD